MSDNESLPIEIDVQTVSAMLQRDDPFVLIDCREQDEYETAKIDGSVLIPMSEMQARVQELEQRKDQHLVIHCHHGARSMRVVQWLQQQGFDRVQNMAGGIDAWSREIDPAVPTY